MISSPIERAKIINKVEACITEHNKHHEGLAIFIAVDWPENSIHLLYKSCCGENVHEASYGILEKRLLIVHQFNQIVWRFRRKQ